MKRQRILEKLKPLLYPLSKDSDIMGPQDMTNHNQWVPHLGQTSRISGSVITLYKNWTELDKAAVL